MEEENNTLIEQLTYLAETKEQIKDAIEEKGQTISADDTFRSYVTKIENINTVNAQAVNVDPQLYAQSITPDQDHNALSEVIVNAVTANIDEDIIPENIKNGVNILGVIGNVIEGVDTSDATATVDDMAYGTTAYVNGNKLTGTISVQNQGYVLSAYKNVEYHNSSNYLTVGINPYYDTLVRTNGGLATDIEYTDIATGINLQADQIKVGSSVLSVAGTYTSDADATAGDIWRKTAYVNGEKLTGTLQTTQNVTRDELDSKIDMWNTFTNFSTTGNNLSNLFNNMSQKLLPTITANDIVDMSNMYNNCRNLIEVDITKLNTINTTNMDNMFSNCSNLNYTNLNQLNLNSFKTNNLQTAKGMFDNCINLTDIDIAN